MSLAGRIAGVKEIIQHTAISCHRQPDEIKLLAVSKGHTSHDIKQAFAAGLHDFGENYVQEALIKIQALSSLPLCWHFIGAIQGNKARVIAQHFSWVHGVSRSKIAQQLNDARPASMPPLNVCIQINIDQEKSKSGIDPALATELTTDILRLPRLQLRGLMVIPKPLQDEQQQYETYLSVARLLHRLNTDLNLSMDTLSMGMSDDLPAAIRAGSTMVRVGRAIFGERIYKTG